MLEATFDKRHIYVIGGTLLEELDMCATRRPKDADRYGHTAKERFALQVYCFTGARPVQPTRTTLPPIGNARDYGCYTLPRHSGVGWRALEHTTRAGAGRDTSASDHQDNYPPSQVPPRKRILHR